MTKIKLTILLFLLSFLDITGGYIPFSDNIIFEAKKMDFYMRALHQPFSEKLLKECLYYEKIKNPSIVLLQARLETGDYTSIIFQDNSNLFGMKYAKGRETPATGILYGHAYYSHWTDSVKDYKLFQEWYLSVGWRLPDNDSDLYLVFLKCIRYARDPHYISKLIKLSEKDIS
jgi:flagellum-specific peptidoglycan hydrolase FlgJ